MKISPQIDAIAAELEDWAIQVGWKTVGHKVAEIYHANGGGKILPKTNTEKGLNNATQRVKRIFRGYDGPRYGPQAKSLINSALTALPIERRAKLETPDDPVFLAALAAREGIHAVNAVHLGAAPDLVIQAINEAIAAFIAIKLAIERLLNTDSWEVCRGNYA